MDSNYAQMKRRRICRHADIVEALVHLLDHVVGDIDDQQYHQDDSNDNQECYFMKLYHLDLACFLSRDKATGVTDPKSNSQRDKTGTQR
jgi:hypothetical protein